MPYSSCENYCMSRYSALSLIKNAISGHKNWTKSWQSPAPKKQYDAIIIGGGGHGLATAYYFCLLYTSPSPRDRQKSRMPSSA